MNDELVYYYWYFWEKYTPFSGHEVLKYSLIGLLIGLNIYLWIYSISGLKNKRIIVRVARQKTHEFIGKEAVRISIYYLIASFAVTFALIFFFLLKFSFSPGPFQIFKDNKCIFGC